MINAIQNTAAAARPCPSWCTQPACYGDHHGDSAVIAGTHGAPAYPASSVTVAPVRCDLEDGLPAVAVTVRGADSEADAFLTITEAQQLIRRLQASLAAVTNSN